MAIKRPDIYENNNPAYAFVDSNFVRGGIRTGVADLTALYALDPTPSAPDQFKEHSTIVYVSGESKYYVLKDISQIGNINGWTEFVTGGGAGTLTGATNGLQLFSSGTSVGLGGTLKTGITTTVTIPDYTSTLKFVDGGSCLNFNAGTIGICDVDGWELTVDGFTNAVYLGKSAVSQGTLSNSGVYFSSTGGSAIRICSGYVDICGTPVLPNVNYSVPFDPINDGILFRDDDDKSVHLVTLDTLTSGITGTITGGTNGLSEIGKDVILGGILLSGTTINVGGNSLILSGATGAVCSFIGTPTSYSCASVSSSCVSLEKVSATNCAYIDIAGVSITTCSKGGNLDYGTNGNMIITAPSGATYAGCYHNNYTDRTLVDKEYVDNSKSHVCVVVTDSDPYYITGLDIEYVGVSGVTDDRVYLPSGVSLCVGRKITIADVCGEALTHRIVIDGAGKCVNNNGCAVINTDYGSITLLYNGYFWSPISFVN